MTTEANDADKAKWVLHGEMPIRKKGAGRGIHRSDIICSTVGHIDDAGQGMEYGKNYEGYWDGAQFIKQVNFPLSRVSSAVMIATNSVPFFSSTTLRATAHMRRMLWLFLG
jgi:hypothetical protein